jgi:hypothetical protein
VHRRLPCQPRLIHTPAIPTRAHRENPCAPETPLPTSPHHTVFPASNITVQGNAAIAVVTRVMGTVQRHDRAPWIVRLRPDCSSQPFLVCLSSLIELWTAMPPSKKRPASAAKRKVQIRELQEQMQQVMRENVDLHQRVQALEFAVRDQEEAHEGHEEVQEQQANRLSEVERIVGGALRRLFGGA